MSVPPTVLLARLEHELEALRLYANARKEETVLQFVGAAQDLARQLRATL